MADSRKKQFTVAEGVYRRGDPKRGTLYVAVWNPAKGKSGGKDWYAGSEHGFDTIRAAKAFKAEKQRELKNAGTSEETVRSFAARWTVDYARQKMVTNNHNAERVRGFVKDFGDRPLAGITRKEAQKWTNDNMWATKSVRAMFSDAKREGLLEGGACQGDSPFSGIKLPSSVTDGRKDIIVLTESELEQLVAIAVRKHGAGEGEYGQVFGAMIQVAAYTGMRPGELYALRWSDIDYERDELRIARQYRSKTNEVDLPKMDKRRTIVLLPQAAAALKRVPKREGIDDVWFTKRGKPYTQRVQHYNWDPVRTIFWEHLSPARQEQIPAGFDFYELRHFFGTYLAQMDPPCSPYEIALMMGHSDGGALAMERYIHIAEDSARDRIKKRMWAQIGPHGDTAADDPAADAG